MEASSRTCYRRLPALLLGGLLCLGGTARATAEVLEWTVWPLPGMVNVEHGVPTDGISMAGVHLLMAELPDLQPEFRLANRLRQQRDMGLGHEFCTTPRLRRTDADQVGYFIPFMASTPIQAVIRKADLVHYPQEKGGLSLHQLLHETTFRGGLSSFRTYPPSIENWFNEAQKRGRAEYITGSQGGENLLLMVSHGRLDITFEFATITQAMSKRLRMKEPLLSLPIHEQRALVEGGIYCTRSEWGRNMALRLDQAVRDIVAEPQSFMALYEQWVPSETYQAFATELADYYRRRAQQPTYFGPPTVSPAAVSGPATEAAKPDSVSDHLDPIEQTVEQRQHNQRENGGKAKTEHDDHRHALEKSIAQ